MDSPNSPPKIKRATRTYGRRRIPDDSEPETPAGPSATSKSSPALSSTNNSPAFSVSYDDLPPSSDVDLDVKDASFEDDNDGSYPGQTMASDGDDDYAIPSKFGFGRRDWRKDVALIDKHFDEMEDEEVVPSQINEPTNKEDNGPLSNGSWSTSLPEDLLHATRPHLTGLLQAENADSASPSPSVRRVVKRHLEIADSDDEPSAAVGPQTSPQTPPATLHHIGTPSSRSSPTPPTSQDMSSVRRLGTGKEKRQSFEPNDDDAKPSSAEDVSSRNIPVTRKRKAKRSKAPSKKEQLETQKATARIIAQQQTSLPRGDKRLKLTSIFEKLAHTVRNVEQDSAMPEEPNTLSSDPIQPFSSPAHIQPTSFVAKLSSLRPPSFPRASTSASLATGLPSNNEVAESSSRPEGPRHLPKKHDDVFQTTGLLGDIEPQTAEESSDEELPTMNEIFAEDSKKREKLEARKKLLIAKEQYLKNRAPPSDKEDDDSDLEVVRDDMHAVAREEQIERRSRKAETLGKQKQLIYAGKAKAIRSPTKGTPLRGGKRDFEILAAAAAPSFAVDVRARARKGKEREDAKVNPKDLNRLLLQASEKQSRELAAQKETEFYKKLGHRREQTADVAKVDVLEALARKGLENSARDIGEEGDDEAQGEDDSDRDWTPTANIEEDEEAEVSEELPIATDDDQDPLGHGDDEENVENVENIYIKPRRPHPHVRAIIDSDDDDGDAENQAPSNGRVLVAGSSLAAIPTLDVPRPSLNHRGSVSSFEERIEEGTDKENDSRLMFDRGEDKENTAVASQSSSVVVSPLAPLGGGSSFALLSQSLMRTSSPSPTGEHVALLRDERVPFKELRTGEDDDDTFFSPSARDRHKVRTPSKTFDMKSQSLSPLQLRGTPGRGHGLSAFFEDDEAAQGDAGPSNLACSLEPAAIIRPGLSQLFEASLNSAAAGSPAPLQLGKGGGFSQFETPAKGPFGFFHKSKTQDLSLSLGASLQPALEVDENLMRRADQIFEKDQEYLVAETRLSPQTTKKSELFVNKLGFLTQTRPPSSPTSPAFTVGASSVQRQPLRTLALSTMEEEEDEDENMRPRRLRRRGSTSPEQAQGYRPSISPSPAKARTAFDVLGLEPSKIKAPQFEKRKKLEKSAFIEGEAEESDEDAGFGFGLVKRDDEEDLDGEDQDQVLEELVDDAAMDDDTLNEDKVLEKVQEHRALDDASDEKIARDAAEGKMRVKRRNHGLDFEDDESDEDDWEARNARARVAKKRKIDGDTLDAIEKNPETRAFAAAYRVDDDENDFAHLEQDEVTLIGGPSADGFDDYEDENDENDEQELVDAVQLRQQLQRVARGEESVDTIDVHDVAWLDDDDEDMDDEIRVKEITAVRTGPPRTGALNNMEWDLMNHPRRGDNHEDVVRQQKWARSEGSSRNIGTGRASAVTGIAKSSKSGGSSITARRNGDPSAPLQTTKQASKLAKAQSALSAVSSRRQRFG